MKSLAKKLLEKFDRTDEESRYSISAPKDTPKGAQTYIIHFCKDGSSKPFESSKTTTKKRLTAVIKQIQSVFRDNDFIKDEIERGDFDRVKIFTTFEDNYEKDSKDPVLDLSVKEFIKL